MHGSSIPESEVADAPAEAAKTPPPLPLGRVLVALAMGSMLTPLNSTMVSVLLDDIGHEFGEPTTRLMQALVTSYLVVSIVMQAPAGKLGDRFGHLGIVRIGLGLFACGSVAAIAAHSLVPLAIARVVMAVGGALVVPSAAAIIRIHVPIERRASAFGIFGASMAFSAAAGPVVGSRIMAMASHANPELPAWLDALLGFRACFALNLIIVPCAFLLLPRLAAPPARAGSATFDWFGSVLLGASLTALVVGANHVGEPLGPALLLACLVGVVGFVAWEKRHPEPIVDLALMRKGVFVAGGAITGLQNLAMYALLFELPAALSTIGLDRSDRGKLLTTMMIAMVFISPISGRLSDRFGPRIVALTGSAFGLAGLGGLYVIGLADVGTLAPPMVLFGMGLGLGASPSQAAAMTVSPPESSGVASAMLAIHRYLGGILGTVVLAVMTSARSDGGHSLAAHRQALTVFAVALLLSACAALVLPGRMAKVEPASR